MKNTGKIAAVLLTIVLCFSVLGAAFCLAEHCCHDCTGAGCSVCAVLEQCEQRVRGAVSAFTAATLLLFFACEAVELTVFGIREAAGVTPVKLKVKLLN